MENVRLTDGVGDVHVSLLEPSTDPNMESCGARDTPVLAFKSITRSQRAARASSTPREPRRLSAREPSRLPHNAIVVGRIYARDHHSVIAVRLGVLARTSTPASTISLMLRSPMRCRNDQAVLRSGLKPPSSCARWSLCPFAMWRAKASCLVLLRVVDMVSADKSRALPIQARTAFGVDCPGERNEHRIATGRYPLCYPTASAGTGRDGTTLPILA